MGFDVDPVQEVTPEMELRVPSTSLATTGLVMRVIFDLFKRWKFERLKLFKNKIAQIFLHSQIKAYILKCPTSTSPLIQKTSLR